jgi:hypothetical protein
MKKIVVAIAPLFLLAVSVKAQSDVDALRYSQSSITGTARYVSMGGAFGALGGDLSCMSNNPAGLGIYRKSELSFSPAIYHSKVNSAYFGNSDQEFKNNFNFGNIGMVLNFPTQRYDTLNGWNSFNFGIGYNRINNFTAKSGFYGMNNQNSYIDYFVQDASSANGGRGTNPSNLSSNHYQFGANLAFYTFMINPLSNKDSTHYASAIPGGGAKQSFSSITSGASSEIPVSFAGNYSDKLYLGATVGFASINYQQDITFTETATDKTRATNLAYGMPIFKDYTYTQSLTTTGSGLNFKFGTIYKAKDWLRLGASIHSPTYYQMNNANNAQMVSNFEGEKSHAKSSPNNSFAYQINTPMRLAGSLAFIIGKLGLISADIEYVDYAEMNMSSITDPFYDTNLLIQTTYTSTTNIKLGTEWRYNEFSFRGGLAYLGSPFKSQQNSVIPFNGTINSKTAISFGAGIRERDYFIDFGYVLTVSPTVYVPYTLSADSPVSTMNLTSQNYVLTIGFKF